MQSDNFLTLWLHQESANAAMNAGRSSGLWSIPTGGGKAYAFASFARDLKLPTLMMVQVGVQGGRAPVYALEEQMKVMTVPTLIMLGDEDDACIEPSVFMKRNIPCSGLVMFPQSGHPINLEEPDLFNRSISDFLTAVEAGKWATFDPGDASGSLT